LGLTDLGVGRQVFGLINVILDGRHREATVFDSLGGGEEVFHLVL
jgi:hypothetical protein